MAHGFRERIGQYGIWRAASQTSADLARAIEREGYGAIWLGGSPDGDLAIVDELLTATSSIVIGTSIVNIWKDDAATVARSFAWIHENHPGRFLLGIGTGHPEATSEYTRPYDAIARYVDALLASHVPADSIVLAALGPRVLQLAAERTAGAIPYLVTPEHTRQARQILGPHKLLAPEHKVVLDTDAARARALGGDRVRRPYLSLVNYTANLRRLGFTDDDLALPGSDRLIDALVAHGNAADAAAKVTAHLDAGADHVCIQLLTPDGADPASGYADLARAVGLEHRPG